MENEAGVPSVGWEQDAILVGADDVSEFNEDIVLPQSPEVIARIRKWLQPTSYDGSDSEYWKHLSSHLAGTGTWLLSSPTYQEWHSSPDMGILWILGNRMSNLNLRILLMSTPRCAWFWKIRHCSHPGRPTEPGERSRAVLLLSADHRRKSHTFVGDPGLALSNPGIQPASTIEAS
jgi:hypothetical protein